MGEYIQKTFDSVQPVFAFIISILMYVMFPEDSYIPAFCSVIVVMLLDVVTKYYSLSKQSGGFIQALKDHVINSNSMWVGTSRKIVDYLIIFIMVGLSYRVSPIAGAVVFLGTVVYGFMFLRECQSILENLEDCGHDVGWMLSLVKKKKQKVAEDGGIDDGKDIIDN